jgi:hypothetical protein
MTGSGTDTPTFVFDVLGTVIDAAPAMEPIGLDEAYLDLSRAGDRAEHRERGSTVEETEAQFAAAGLDPARAR